MIWISQMVDRWNTEGVWSVVPEGVAWCRGGSLIQVGADVRISGGVTIGDRVIIGTNVHIGRFTHIADEVAIGSNVSIQNRVSIRYGAALYDGSAVGDDATVGVLAIVLADRRVENGVQIPDVNREHASVQNTEEAYDGGWSDPTLRTEEVEGRRYMGFDLAEEESAPVVTTRQSLDESGNVVTMETREVPTTRRIEIPDSFTQAFESSTLEDSIYRTLTEGHSGIEDPDIVRDEDDDAEDEREATRNNSSSRRSLHVHHVHRGNSYVAPKAKEDTMFGMRIIENKDPRINNAKTEQYKTIQNRSVEGSLTFSMSVIELNKIKGGTAYPSVECYLEGIGPMSMQLWLGKAGDEVRVGCSLSVPEENVGMFNKGHDTEYHTVVRLQEELREAQKTITALKNANKLGTRKVVRRGASNDSTNRAIIKAADKLRDK